MGFPAWVYDAAVEASRLRTRGRSTETAIAMEVGIATTSCCCS